MTGNLADGLQVLKFVSEACSTCTQTEPHCSEPNELQLLWKLLQLLCQHKGDLHSAVTPGVSDTRPGELMCGTHVLTIILQASLKLMNAGVTTLVNTETIQGSCGHFSHTGMIPDEFCLDCSLVDKMHSLKEILG